MKWLICESNQVIGNEKKIFARYLRTKLQLNAWATAYNVQSDEEDDISLIDDDDIDSDIYPILGWKGGSVNKTSGYTKKAIEFRELTNGKFAAAFPETTTLVITDRSDPDNWIFSEQIVDNSLLLTGVLYSEWTNVEPDWLLVE